MDDAPVIVETFRYLPDAETARVLLETRGIEARLSDIETTNMDWFWGAWTGQIKLEVPRSQVEEATRLLALMRQEQQKHRSKEDEAGSGSACLRCGKPMSDEEERCSQCGWSCGAASTTDYENGPVPDHLLGFVYSPLGSHQFALSAKRIEEYLDWCVREGYIISGWEVWLRDLVGHAVMRTEDKGTAAELRAIVPAMLAEHGSRAVFCPRVVARGMTRSDDA